MEDLDLKGSPPCPADGTPMQDTDTNGSVRTCPERRGILFTQTQLARIIRHHGVDRLRAGGVRAALRACPGCGKGMRIYDIEGIEIDACALCPCVWMDAGEFPAAKSALERMDAARGLRRGLGPVPEPRIGPLDLPLSESLRSWLFSDILGELVAFLIEGHL